MNFKLCVAQLNFVVGDLSGNAQKIIDCAHEVYKDGVRLLLTPELSICGYAAEDLFLRPAFVQACDRTLASIVEALAKLNGMTVVVGHPMGGGFRSRSVSIPGLLNAASVVRDGKVIATYAKRELPNYQVFDERRYFVPGDETCVFEVGEGDDLLRVGLLICEDAWFSEHARATQQAGAQLLAVLNASPFHLGKGDERERMMQERVRETGLPLIYAHLVGGQDEVVFEGNSFCLDTSGGVSGRAPSFVEDKFVVSPVRNGHSVNLVASTAPSRSPELDLWDALVLGVHDYVEKNRFPTVLIGLSGGVDSALVLAVAVDALGANRVRAVMMPSPYTADISWQDASEMARRVGVRYDEISIRPHFEAFKASLANEFIGVPEDATEENIQARIRGTILMALSNKFGGMVLTTGNKSEMATGYCTLYGDMAGGFAVIKDLAKTQVFKMAKWRNLHDPYHTCEDPIPSRIITRPPSAELRHDQKDQDSLPAYEVLDGIIDRYMEDDQSIESIVAAGFNRVDVEKVTRLIQVNEYKRRQAPVGIRLTHRSFGKDWRYPITNRFRA